MRILFFIESLRSGGKERRLLELIRYLSGKSGYELMLVLTEDEIHYNYATDLINNIRIIKRKFLRKDPMIFLKFFRISNAFKPDIIHTWGSMLAFYAIPAVLLKKIPHVNGHIADAPVNLKRSGFNYYITRIGFRFSDVILSNSLAGLKSYNVTGKKCRVIYNGLNLSRFDHLDNSSDVRMRYNIRTRFLVTMVASFTPMKNYDQFLEVAESFMGIRDDVTFLAVGDTKADTREFDRIRTRAQTLANTRLLEKVTNVESLVNASDIGLLFTYSEGISNSVLEFMACKKPVLATDAGGTSEIILNRETGFLLHDQSTSKIAWIIIALLNDESLRSEIGSRARTVIEKRFALELMGENFETLYKEMLGYSAPGRVWHK